MGFFCSSSAFFMAFSSFGVANFFSAGVFLFVTDSEFGPP